MADIVNLKRARKEKMRRERDREARANRLRHGRTKIEKALDEDRAARQRRILDGKRLGPDEPGER